MNTINSLEIPKRIIVKKDKVFSKKDIDIENTVIRGLLYKMFSNSAISSTIKRSYEITTEELLEAIERTHHTTEKEDKYLKIDFKLPLKDGIFIELQLKLKSLRYLKYNDIRITSSEWYRLQRTKSINHLQITACLDCDYEDIDLKNLSAESNIIACCGICVTSKWNPFYDEDLDYRANRGYSLSYDNAYKSGQDFKESVRNQYPGRTHVISDDCISYAQYKYKSKDGSFKNLKNPIVNYKHRVLKEHKRDNLKYKKYFLAIPEGIAEDLSKKGFNDFKDHTFFVTFDK